jgi:hypothetical protein
MAKEPRRKKSPNQLSAEIARTRDLVERDLRDLRSQLDIPRKIRRSFRRQTGVWIAAVAVVGVLIAIQSTRKKKVYVEKKGSHISKSTVLEAGFVLGALRIAATLFRPMIMKFVAKKVQGYAGRAHSAKKW